MAGTKFVAKIKNADTDIFFEIRDTNIYFYIFLKTQTYEKVVSISSKQNFKRVPSIKLSYKQSLNNFTLTFYRVVKNWKVIF